VEDLAKMNIPARHLSINLSAFASVNRAFKSQRNVAISPRIP
jgi:hypothetical protein